MPSLLQVHNAAMMDRSCCSPKTHISSALLSALYTTRRVSLIESADKTLIFHHISYCISSWNSLSLHFNPLSKRKCCLCNIFVHIHIQGYIYICARAIRARRIDRYGFYVMRHVSSWLCGKQPGALLLLLFALFMWMDFRYIVYHLFDPNMCGVPFQTGWGDENGK